MAADEMKKNVEKLDELDDALKRAQEELIVCSVCFTHLHNLYPTFLKCLSPFIRYFQNVLYGH